MAECSAAARGGDRHRLRGARKAAAQRRVSSRGGIMVATQKIQVGLIHVGKIVAVTAEDHSFRLAVDGQASACVILGRRQKRSHQLGQAGGRCCCVGKEIP